MQHIIYFIQKYKYFLLFLFLELTAFLVTIQSRSYPKSQFINSANSITGGFFETTNSIFEYTSLKKENLRLAEENARLRNILDTKDNTPATIEIDSSKQTYRYITAKIINNNFTKKNNILTIDKGFRDSLTIDMGVINSKGIIGIVNNVGEKYATVLSILNSKSNINVRLKNTHYFGTLQWNGEDYKTVQLVDIQRQAPLHIGDTIESDGKSSFFPEGIPIGIVKDFKTNHKKYENIEVRLFNDMSNLGYVSIIKNLDKQEIQQLENSND